MDRVLSIKRKTAQTRSRKIHRLVLKQYPPGETLFFLEKVFWSSKSQ